MVRVDHSSGAEIQGCDLEDYRLDFPDRHAARKRDWYGSIDAGDGLSRT